MKRSLSMIHQSIVFRLRLFHDFFSFQGSSGAVGQEEVAGLDGEEVD